MYGGRLVNRGNTHTLAHWVKSMMDMCFSPFLGDEVTEVSGQWL